VNCSGAKSAAFSATFAFSAQKTTMYFAGSVATLRNGFARTTLASWSRVRSTTGTEKRNAFSSADSRCFSERVGPLKTTLPLCTYVCTSL